MGGLTLCPRWTFWIALRQLRINHPSLPTPIINKKKRALDVAVIGAPNVGKSLLTNQIVRAAVSAVSSKMDTTTKNNEAIVTEDDVQMVVVDSPGTIGLGHAKEMMGRSGQDRILSDPEEAITRSQHILVVQDATATGDYIHHRVLHLLHRHSHIPSSLVFNKVDLVTKRPDLLELTRILTNGRVGEQPIKVARNTIGRLGSSLNNKQELHSADLKENDAEWMTKYRQLLTRPTHECGYAETKRLFIDIRGWSHFSAVFFASALTGEGVQPIRNHLKGLAEEREWRMDENAVTTKTPQAICVESVRAALLDTLPGDIAYKLQPKISEWSQEGEVLQIVVDVPCEKERWAKLIIGKSGGSRMIEIGKRVNEQMSTLFQRQLFIRILVKYKGRIVNFSPMNIQQTNLKEIGLPQQTPLHISRPMSLRPSQSHPSVSASMVNARGGASSSLGRPPHLATQLTYQHMETHYQYGTQQHHFAGEHLVQTAGLSLNVPVRESTPQPLEIKTEIKEEPVDVASTSNQLLSQPPPEDDGEINIEIRNVVCNYTLPFHIELRRVALNSLNVQLDPGKGALVKQLRNPWCLIKIYNSGKVYIVGCRSELEAMRAARKVARCIQRSMDKLEKRICMRNYKICNVLATCRLPFGIKIEEMAQKYKEHSTYEPELSVGLVWRNKIPKATLRIHTTGSITVTGAQSEADVTTILTDIYEKVWEFRCIDRNRLAKGTRKRKVNNQRSDGPSHKQQSFNREGNQPTSGLVGNRVYFSDEDEDEDEEFFDEDEEDF